MDYLSDLGADIIPTEEENYEQRVPCVLVIDCSLSMTGKIEAVNDGIKEFARVLGENTKAQRAARIAIVRVGGDVTIVQPMIDGKDFLPIKLEASGYTPLGEGINRALDLLEAEKGHLESMEANFYRPWLFIFTDGAPTDSEIYEKACRRAKSFAADKKVVVFPIAVEGADEERLKEVSEKGVIRMEGARFAEFFVFLSRSIETTSRSADELSENEKNAGVEVSDLDAPRLSVDDFKSWVKN